MNTSFRNGARAMLPGAMLGALALSGQGAWAISVGADASMLYTHDGGSIVIENIAPDVQQAVAVGGYSGISPFDPLFGDALDASPGGWEIGSAGDPILMSLTPGAGHMGWVIDDTVGVLGSFFGYLPGITRYDVTTYLTVDGTTPWDGFRQLLSPQIIGDETYAADNDQCCYQWHDAPGADGSGGTSVGPSVTILGTGEDVMASVVTDTTSGDGSYLTPRSVTYTFNRQLNPGETVVINSHIFYTMPIPLVSDGPKIVRMAPLTAVPVPAAVWLFGSAIGILGWVRRRRAT